MSVIYICPKCDALISYRFTGAQILTVADLEASHKCTTREAQ